MALDVAHLTDFVSKLENAFMLEQNLDELQQTVALMQSENHEEFYDISIRNKKYGRVDATNGPLLLEKYVSLRLIFPRKSTFGTERLATKDSGILTSASGLPRRWRTQSGQRNSLTSVRASACDNIHIAFILAPHPIRTPQHPIHGNA